MSSTLCSGRVPADLVELADRIPSMGGRQIGHFLRKAAEDAPPGTAIVEVGTWFGSGTAQLALGVRQRRAVDVAIHCYDRWQANESEVTKAKKFGVSIEPYENTLPRVMDTLQPFEVPIAFHRGEATKASWRGGVISVFVLDAAKQEHEFRQVLRTFGPSWQEGTLLVLMDYRHWMKSAQETHRFQQTFIESHPDHFIDEHLESPTSSAAFRYRQVLDFDGV
jgi:hypothetical protein